MSSGTQGHILLCYYSSYELRHPTLQSSQMKKRNNAEEEDLKLFIKPPSDCESHVSRLQLPAKKSPDFGCDSEGPNAVETYPPASGKLATTSE